MRRKRVENEPSSNAALGMARGQVVGWRKQALEALIDAANYCSSHTSPLAKSKPHKLTSSCSPCLRKGAHERLRAGCNGGNSWNCFERKILDFNDTTSRFAANGTAGLPKRPTKRGPEGLLLCGSHKQLKVRVCWTGRLLACRSSRPGSGAGSNQQVWRARQENTTQMAGDCCPAHPSLACVLTT